MKQISNPTIYELIYSSEEILPSSNMFVTPSNYFTVSINNKTLSKDYTFKTALYPNKTGYFLIIFDFLTEITITTNITFSKFIKDNSLSDKFKLSPSHSF